MQKVIVIDMDGTLVDCRIIQPFLRTKPRNWNAFFAGLPYCPPVFETLDFVLGLRELGRQWVVGTARPEDRIDITLANLQNFGLTGDNAPLKIYHRPANDYRPDDIIKVEMVERMHKDGIKPVLWLDDKESVCNALREKCKLTVWQVAKCTRKEEE